MSLSLWKRRSKWHDKPGNLVRSIEQWRQIFTEQTDESSEEVAARILGDIHCYNAMRGDNVRTQFYDDVHQLASALRAYRNWGI